MRDVSHDIVKMNLNELKEFIRSRLRFNQHEHAQLRTADGEPHRRFDMSGYGDGCGSCVVHNQGVLNLFRDCGIYNHVRYLYVDAYKGTITVHYQLWDDPDDERKDHDYSGCGTVEIIADILLFVVYRPIDSGAHDRRVD